MSNFQEVGVAFTRHYYTQFDTNRANLRSLYVSYPYPHLHITSNSVRHLP